MCPHLTIAFAGCKSNFAKEACQLIVEQMHLIYASVAPGNDGEHPVLALLFVVLFIYLKCRDSGPNHKGQVCSSECDLQLCNHAGKTLNQEHWSCCGHRRHEPCIPPAKPAPPQKQSGGDDESASLGDTLMMPKVAGDLAKLIVAPDECGFPGTTFEEKKSFFFDVSPPPLCAPLIYNLSKAASIQKINTAPQCVVSSFYLLFVTRFPTANGVRTAFERGCVRRVHQIDERGALARVGLDFRCCALP